MLWTYFVNRFVIKNLKTQGTESGKCFFLFVFFWFVCLFVFLSFLSFFPFLSPPFNIYLSEDTGTRVLDNTRPFLRSSIVSFWITPAHSKEHKYHIFRQYWYTRNVPVFANTGTCQYLGPEVCFFLHLKKKKKKKIGPRLSSFSFFINVQYVFKNWILIHGTSTSSSAWSVSWHLSRTSSVPV